MGDYRGWEERDKVGWNDVKGGRKFMIGRRKRLNALWKDVYKKME
jgi:hypothetical protein